MADYERWTVEQDEKNNGGDKPSVNIHIYTQADHPVCTAAAAALHTWPGIIMLMLENEVSHETKQHTHTHSLDSVTVSVIFFFSVFAFLHLARTAFVRSFTGNGRACVISGFMFRAIITWCTFLYIYFVSLYPSFFSVCLGVGCCSWWNCCMARDWRLYGCTWLRVFRQRGVGWWADTQISFKVSRLISGNLPSSMPDACLWAGLDCPDLRSMSPSICCSSNLSPENPGEIPQTLHAAFCGSRPSRFHSLLFFISYVVTSHVSIPDRWVTTKRQPKEAVKKKKQKKNGARAHSRAAKYGR